MEFGEDNPLFKEIGKILQQAQSQQELEAIEAVEKQKRQHELFEHLDETDLIALKSIFTSIVGSVNPQASANYWRGYAKSLANVKFGVKPYKEAPAVSDLDLNALLEQDDGEGS